MPEGRIRRLGSLFQNGGKPLFGFRNSDFFRISGIRVSGFGLNPPIRQFTNPMLGDRLHSHARTSALGLAVLVVGLATVALWQTSLGLGCALCLIGVGGGALGPSLLALLGQHVKGDERGVAVGMLQLCGDVGGMLGPLVGTTLLASDLMTPYLVSAGVTALAMPLAIGLALEERNLLRRAAVGL